MNNGAAIDDGFVYKQEVHLTVLKTSVFFAGDGFAAYTSDGQLLLRADSYGPDKRHQGELVLMDAAGKCLLTLRRKWPSLHQRWEGFSGERTEGQKPIFSVRWSSIIGRSSVTVEVYDDPGEEYKIEGCFAQRNCTIFNAAAGEEPVAEIRRKVDPSANVVLGREVFSLSLKPGFDGAFAMGLVLVLDQIHADDHYFFANKGDDSRVGAEPISDD
ncbi:protein LURP-one-related 5-like [Ipomoea triloba]|uniref:protein LURP-one-related 5-like n=1 Tax=Ipomoea triloba TaxID=35885 RepID=UPI00125E4AA8|nr:protein LURP-one-related 5-like [Ipomoea triloba]